MPDTTAAVRTHHRSLALAALLLALGAGTMLAAILGPLVAGAIDYRTSDTTLNQIVGGDFAALVVVAPVALLAGVLVLRGHRAGPVVALAPATWAVYVYAQLIVGQEYLDLPGNNEAFFPLLLALFITGEAIAVLAWRAVDAGRLPPLSRRLERTAGVVLLVLATFLVVGLHLPTLLDALGGEPSRVEYVSSPTAFWVVKLMDLGIIVPAAIAAGVGLLRSAPWAGKAAYAILGGYTLLATAVAGMAVVMLANDDPDGSLANVVVFGLFMVGLAWLTARLYRPLFESSTVGRSGDAGEVGGAGPREVDRAGSRAADSQGPGEVDSQGAGEVDRSSGAVRRSVGEVDDEAEEVGLRAGAVDSIGWPERRRMSRSAPWSG